MSDRSAHGRRIAGVMIDGDVLRGVELRKHKNNLRVIATAEVALRSSVSGFDAGFDVDGVAAGLTELWNVGAFGTKRIAFGINGRDATIRPMTVPPAAIDDIAGYVRYQLGDYLSYELDEAVIDHQVVSTDGDASTEVVAIGVPVALVERIAEAVELAGLELDSIDAAPTALASTIDRIDDSDEGDAVVSVDGSRTTVVLRGAGRPRVVRVLDAGGGDRTTQLAEELEGMIARVEGHQSRSTPTTSVADAQERRFAEAAKAVADAIDYDLREHTGTGVSQVILTGAYGRFTSLHDLMAEASGAPVAAATVPAWWTAGGEDVGEDFDHFVEPAGLAFSAVSKQARSFDLMPPAVLEARAERRQLAVGVGLAAFVAVASIGALAPHRSATAAAEREVIALEADIASLSSRVDDLALIGQLDDAREGQIDAVESALHDDLWWGRVLAAVSDATPPATYLTSMTLERPVGLDDDAVADFTGVSSDQAAVGHWLDAITQLGIFDEVWLVQSTGTVLGEEELPVVTFLVKARLTSEARSPRAVDTSTWLQAEFAAEDPS